MQTPSSNRAAPASNDAARWHALRHRTLLDEHPELRSLFGADARTALWILALVIGQLALATCLRHAPAATLVVTVLLVGAPIAHAIGVLIHECAHNLVFRATWANKVAAIVANLGLGAPGALAFRHEHLLHHRHLGDSREPDGGDTQAPHTVEVAWAGTSGARKLFAFTFGRFLFHGRTTDAPPKDVWLRTNQLTCGTLMVALLLLAGPESLAYILLSLLFAFGPHPLGARRIGEHLTLRAGQPTSSYYGLGNAIAFNVGYHVEHHDFPHVPWTRLKDVRRIAHAAYGSLGTIGSWTRLLADYLLRKDRHPGQYTGFCTDVVERTRRTAGALPVTTPELLRGEAHPYFLDEVTVDELHRHLAARALEERVHWMGLLLQHANTRDVWLFVTPEDVRAVWGQLARHLGDTADRWAWLLRMPPPATSHIVAHA